MYNQARLDRSKLILQVLQVTKKEFARLINLVLDSFNEVDVSVTNPTHVLSVICLEHDGAIGLIVDGEVA